MSISTADKFSFATLPFRSLVECVLARAEGSDFAGYDPYDAMNSPLMRLAGAHGKWLRIAMTQLLKRCPFNLRPILCVSKGHNPKAVGLFLGGASRLARLAPAEQHAPRIDRLLDLLGELRSPGYSGNCWGYNFDWQSRTVYRPRGTPTVVNTAFIGHALLDCYELTGNRSAIALALPIRTFILQDLRRTRLEDTFCFSYTPVDNEVVHNANMLGASILIRLNQYCQERVVEEAALTSLAYSMRHQRDDGSWYYADTPLQQWIDSFHTGFNLQALRYFLQQGYCREYEEAFFRGVEFYATHFFLEDGTPKYYHDRTWPIDIHAPAQAIAFFASMPAYRELTDRVLAWMLNYLSDGRGRFFFQKHRLYTNRISYMRWCQAWAFHALTEYALHTREDSYGQTDERHRNAAHPRCSSERLELLRARRPLDSRADRAA
jgi:hypothetical protein